MKKIIFAIYVFSIIWLIETSNSVAYSLDFTNTTKPAKEVVIDLKYEAVVKGDEIKLGDIATVKSNDIDLSVSIDSISLGKAPWPGHYRNFNVGEIMMLLRNRGMDMSMAKFTGAGEVNVSVKSITILGDEIAKYAESYLLNKMNENGEEVILELQQIPGNQIVPLGNGDIKLIFPRIGMGKNKKQIYLPVNIVVDGDIFKSIGLMFNINKFKSVVVAKNGIKQGQLISPDSVELENIETTQLSGQAFSNVNDVIGKIAKKSLSSGNIVTIETVENVYAVSKGDNVIIQIKSSGLKITAKGICMENGGYGDMVKVVNEDTKKVLYGNVIDSGTVEIKF